MPLRKVLAQTAHRPEPLPPGPWVMTQWWRDLLFAHWPLPPSAIAPLLPPALIPDTFDGQAWVGVVPFRMTGVRPRFFPPAPGLSSFAELNLRTYVLPRHGGPALPGVYFWTLEASNPIAVAVARSLFHLAYRNAAMSCHEHNGWIEYTSRRTHRHEPPAALSCRYRPTGPAARTPLTHFLTERYCLYTTDASGALYRGDIHHEPWPLESAAAEWSENTLASASGITLPPSAPLLHFARAIEVAIWPLRRLG